MRAPGGDRPTDELARLRQRYERERTIRLEAEAIAEKATARLYEADRLKSVFLSTVSHELRTPLTAIRGFGDLLLRRWDTLDDDQRLDFVGRIHRNTAVLQALIEDVLDFAQIDRERFALAPVPLRLAEVVPRVLEQVETVLASYRVSLDLEPDVVAQADLVAVTRILTNLLTNATRFSPPGSTVTIGVARRRDQAALTVSDQGPGIPAEERLLVFERFYRGQQLQVFQTRGAGIGLAIVKELAERMGGSVSVDDSPTGGARFCVLLPGAGSDEAAPGAHAG